MKAPDEKKKATSRQVTGHLRIHKRQETDGMKGLQEPSEGEHGSGGVLVGFLGK